MQKLFNRDFDLAMVQAVIEMPAGTSYKYELESYGQMVLDRPVKVPVPYNYGFIPRTLAGDGDPLDIFVVSKEPIALGVRLTATVCGVIKGFDQGKEDNKILAFLSGEALPFALKTWERACRKYLRTYKKGYKIISFEGYSEAIEEIENCNLQFLRDKRTQERENKK